MLWVDWREPHESIAWKYRWCWPKVVISFIKYLKFIRFKSINDWKHCFYLTNILSITLNLICVTFHQKLSREIRVFVSTEGRVLPSLLLCRKLIWITRNFCDIKYDFGLSFSVLFFFFISSGGSDRKAMLSLIWQDWSSSNCVYFDMKRVTK